MSKTSCLSSMHLKSWTFPRSTGQTEAFRTLQQIVWASRQNFPAMVLLFPVSIEVASNAHFFQLGDFPQTFVMRSFGRWKEKSPGGELSSKIRSATKDEVCSYGEFIDLQFDHSVWVHGIFVYETLNPGSIVEIWAGDCKGQWKCMWSGPPSSSSLGHQVHLALSGICI